MVLAFVTVHGSLNSHTAILARTMGIPALVGTKVSLDDLTDGELSVSAGSVLPIRKIIRETRKNMLTEQRYQVILKLLEEKGTVTVTELKDLLNTSESTVRRDIVALHKAGKLTKVFFMNLIRIL